MTTGITGLSKEVQSYFQGQEIRLDTLIRNIFESLKESSTLERWEFIRTARQKGEKQPELYDKFKKAICQERKVSWKNLLLNSTFEVKIELRYAQMFHFSQSLSQTVDSKNRFLEVSEGPFSAIFGSTFATVETKKGFFEGIFSSIATYVSGDDEHRLLDAALTAICQDEQGKFAGYALAAADGGGGHLGDVEQDQNIARAAYGAAQMCVRLFSAYTSPDVLFKDFSNLLKVVGREVKRVGKGESTTLVACRAFPVETGFRVLGVNIGDTMLISWDPQTKKVNHRLPAHRTQAGVALLPESYKPFELYQIDVTVPFNTILLLMTDGAYERLPYHEENGSYPNSLTFTARTLEGIESLLDTPQPFKALFNYTIQETEKLRKAHLQDAAFHLGDDFTLLQCELKKDPKF